MSRSESRSLEVAAVQLESQDDVAQNLARVSELVAAAARRGARLVLLPENFAFMGGSEAEKRELAETIEVEPSERDGRILRRLRELAREHALTLVGGGMPEKSDDHDRPFNTSVVVGPDGRVAARYRKIHLFDVEVGDGHTYRESASTSAGEAPVTAT
ncbi:MAG TPA: nitrilase-related carbon-nitrogen hydrolase, partial [Polyangiaceae bacterium]|nr:nitrilase-related carbon-nitrogen hydrolase [Polyangiaceae bacterium]